MDVIIDEQVHQTIMEFYEASKFLHATLDDITVSNKLRRIYDKVEKLGQYATAYNIARLNLDWKQKGYREYIIEDFHFAYRIYQDENGESFVYIHDVCHSYLYKE